MTKVKDCTCDDCRFLWKEYALEDDDKLTEDARKLKQEILQGIKEHEEEDWTPNK